MLMRSQNHTHIPKGSVNFSQRNRGLFTTHQSSVPGHLKEYWSQKGRAQEWCWPINNTNCAAFSAICRIDLIYRQVHAENQSCVKHRADQYAQIGKTEDSGGGEEDLCSSERQLSALQCDLLKDHSESKWVHDSWLASYLNRYKNLHTVDRLFK